ncbi:MAG: SDR family NAD(P)-dependent oxidoreductase [Caulobacteraceae bacterium]|nr:SDR family NAD(P)-dependent oxidoreductase [Caulobacteraceae bacterium]
MKIGVSGASGKLGAGVLDHLGKRSGIELVGVSRTPSPTAGYETRFGDYDTPESLDAAYAGLDRLLIIPTVALAPGQRAQQNLAAIDAANRAGVGHVVFMSSAGTRARQEPDVWASYFAAEQHLMRTARTWSVLRMNYYAESFADEAKAALAQGALVGLGENRVAFVSRDDLAAAAAGLLAGEGHGGAIYTGTGPRTWSGAGRAELAAKLGGKPLSHVVLTRDALQTKFLEAGLPAHVVEVVLSIRAGFVAGGFDIVTGDIEMLSGRTPRSLEDVLTEAFRNA